MDPNVLDFGDTNQRVVSADTATCIRKIAVFLNRDFYSGKCLDLIHQSKNLWKKLISDHGVHSTDGVRFNLSMAIVKVRLFSLKTLGMLLHIWLKLRRSYHGGKSTQFRPSPIPFSASPKPRRA